MMNVLSVLAHPDDAEFLCSGTLARLAREHKARVHIATMTAGDAGTATMTAAKISAIRRGEARRAAQLIGATYHCLEESDLQIYYGEQTMEKVVRLLRRVQPTLVFTHSPRDYMLDHEMTSTITRAACFAASVPNYLVNRALGHPLPHIPHLYYCDPIEGKDPMGDPILPSLLVDISSVMELKTEMLAAHASQRAWLLKQHGMDEYVESMRAFAAQRGALKGTAAAEGFRQHRGHAYPQDDCLAGLLP